jgi:hypothetical protein
MRWRTLGAALALTANMVVSCTCERKQAPPAMDAAPMAEAGPEAGPRLEAGAAALCERLCAARMSLACPRTVPDCPGACAAAITGPCGRQWTGYFECIVGRPLSDHFCDERGQPQVKPGLCMTEQSAVQSCLQGL